MQFWNELEGQVFDGLYPLRRLQRSEGRSAWFETWIETKAGDGQRATIGLTESLTDADEVAERLERAQRLRHANLVAISKVGRARIDNTLFVYAVMEYTEQNLSDVLRDQALSKEEAQQVGEALAGALTVIHRQGLLHGRVEPASVLAVGETVKLRSDCLQTPGSTRAGDVAGIGATLFQAFTQRKPEAVDDARINRLPAPFAEIVRNSLSSRWGLAQVAAALRPGAAVIAPIAEQAPHSPGPVTASVRPLAAAPVPPAAPSPAKPRSPAPEIARSAPPESGSIPPSATSSRPLSSREDRWSREERDQAGASSSKRLALYVAIGLVLLLLISWIIFRPRANSTINNGPGNHGSGRQPLSPRSAAAPPPPAKTAGTRPAKPPAARVAPAEEATPAAALSGTNALASRPVWRVIAFTYNRQDQAQRKAEEITQQHSDLRPSVFSLSKDGQMRFLVILGGAMDRSRAIALRDKAASMGLPADTYIQNFSR